MRFPSGVVRAAVARAAEAGAGEHRRRASRSPFAVFDGLRLCVLDEAERLHRAAEVGAAVRDEREARPPLSGPLLRMYAVRFQTDLARGTSLNVAIRHCPSGEVGDRAEVDRLLCLLEERRAAIAMKIGGTATSAPITRAEAERGASSRKMLRGSRSAPGRSGASAGRAPARPRRGAGPSRRAAAGHVADPEEAEDEAIAPPIATDPPADDEADAGHRRCRRRSRSATTLGPGGLLPACGRPRVLIHRSARPSLAFAAPDSIDARPRRQRRNSWRNAGL